MFHSNMDTASSSSLMLHARHYMAAFQNMAKVAIEHHQVLGSATQHSGGAYAWQHPP